MELRPFLVEVGHPDLPARLGDLTGTYRATIFRGGRILFEPMMEESGHELPDDPGETEIEWLLRQAEPLVE